MIATTESMASDGEQVNSGFEGNLGEKLCQDILELDGEIIFASIGSPTGGEVASAAKPSTSLLIETNRELKKKYSGMIARIIGDFKEAESTLGKLRVLSASFDKNLRLLIIPEPSEDVFINVITTRDAEEKFITFRVAKLLERFILEK